VIEGVIEPGSPIPVFTASKEIRKKNKGLRRGCAHESRSFAIIRYRDGNEHLAKRCNRCSQNQYTAWDPRVTGRAAARPPQGLSPDPSPTTLSSAVGQIDTKDFRAVALELLSLIEQINTRLGILEKDAKKKKQRPMHPFYDSREWQELKYATLRKYGRKCMACGVSSEEIHVDHIKPRSKYPHLALEIDNLQVLCRICNMGKSNKYEDDWRK